MAGDGVVDDGRGRPPEMIDESTGSMSGTGHPAVLRSPAAVTGSDLYPGIVGPVHRPAPDARGPRLPSARYPRTARSPLPELVAVVIAIALAGGYAAVTHLFGTWDTGRERVLYLLILAGWVLWIVLLRRLGRNAASFGLGFALVAGILWAYLTPMVVAGTSPDLLLLEVEILFSMVLMAVCTLAVLRPFVTRLWHAGWLGWPRLRLLAWLPELVAVELFLVASLRNARNRYVVEGVHDGVLLRWYEVPPVSTALVRTTSVVMWLTVLFIIGFVSVVAVRQHTGIIADRLEREAYEGDRPAPAWLRVPLLTRWWRSLRAARGGTT